MADGYRFDWFLNEEKDLFAVVAVPTMYPPLTSTRTAPGSFAR